MSGDNKDRESETEVCMPLLTIGENHQPICEEEDDSQIGRSTQVSVVSFKMDDISSWHGDRPRRASLRSCWSHSYSVFTTVDLKQFYRLMGFLAVVILIVLIMVIILLAVNCGLN